MRIRELRATGVHGYLTLEVQFRDDLTFLTGLNGSGKTSALRLLMALMTPNLEELGAIEYESVDVTIFEDGQDVLVSAKRSAGDVVVTLSNHQEKLEISSAELELLQQARRNDEVRSPVTEKYLSNPIYKMLRTISTPMFLGLNRRFFVPAVGPEEISDARRREFMRRRAYLDDPSNRNLMIEGSLADVNFLAITRMQEIRAEQEQLDENLRQEFFQKAFEFQPQQIVGAHFKLPSKEEVAKYRSQLKQIEARAEGVKIPIPKIQEALADFFEKMTKVIENLSKSRKIIEEKKKSKTGKLRSKDEHADELAISSSYIQWMVNQPLADRVVEHLQLLEKYLEKRTELRNPIVRFLALVNGFFTQTNKEVLVTAAGQLAVKISGSDTERSIGALSSGERQLLIMLAHLSLNPRLIGSGVFIVDEPELSLHIGWQEKFVEAIREANKDVQLILATHSPAIILDRDDACRSLS